MWGEERTGDGEEEELPQRPRPRRSATAFFKRRGSHPPGRGKCPAGSEQPCLSELQLASQAARRPSRSRRAPEGWSERPPGRLSPPCRCKGCWEGGDREVGAERGEEQRSVASFLKKLYI